MDYLITGRLTYVAENSDQDCEVVLTVIDSNQSNISVLPISNVLSKVAPANLLVIKPQRMIPICTARNGNSLFLVRYRDNCRSPYGGVTNFTIKVHVYIFLIIQLSTLPD